MRPAQLLTSLLASVVLPAVLAHQGTGGEALFGEIEDELSTAARARAVPLPLQHHSFRNRRTFDPSAAAEEDSLLRRRRRSRRSLERRSDLADIESVVHNVSAGPAGGEENAASADETSASASASAAAPTVTADRVQVIQTTGLVTAHSTSSAAAATSTAEDDSPALVTVTRSSSSLRTDSLAAAPSGQAEGAGGIGEIGPGAAANETVAPAGAMPSSTYTVSSDTAVVSTGLLTAAKVQLTSAGLSSASASGASAPAAASASVSGSKAAPSVVTSYSTASARSTAARAASSAAEDDADGTSGCARAVGGAFSRLSVLAAGTAGALFLFA
ncbi:hypothetical protein JCM10207_005223 [Rhodosporidiobolus poonsookiae]